MSDWIERDGKKYFEESYVLLVNSIAQRLQVELGAMRMWAEAIESAGVETRDFRTAGKVSACRLCHARAGGDKASVTR